LITFLQGTPFLCLSLKPRKNRKLLNSH
ncbi:hypothetical protein AZZ66_004274, partial [Escherichia coli]